MNFKLPNLGAVLFNGKLDGDVRSFVHVIGNKAIVQNEVIFIVDLREYVKKECDLSDGEEFDKLDEILAWMNGKIFSKQYWDELKKECLIELVGDQLKVEYNSYKKTLEYEHPDVDNTLLLRSIYDNIGRPCVTIDRIAFKGDVLKKLNSAFGAEMKNDDYVFDFTGKETPIKFTGVLKDYFFGLIPIQYKSTENIFVFSNINEFKDALDQELNAVD
jgi:hypothetical protein